MMPFEEKTKLINLCSDHFPENKTNWMDSVVDVV